MSGLADDWLGDIGRAQMDWVSACARSVDPREICNLVRVIRRSGQYETIELRGRVIGEWRFAYDAGALTFRANGKVYGP